MKPTPLLLAALAGLGLLVAGIAVGAPKVPVLVAPAVPAAAPAPALPEPSDDGYVHLETAIWTADRTRWCSFVELASAPERQGTAVTAQYEYAVAEGAVAKTWRFMDAKGGLTLTADGATCFANAKANLPAGKYRMPLVLESATVAVDPAVDAKLAADPTWLGCFVTFPENVASDFAVPVVVDTDGRVWASDGTRETNTLRDCLGDAATNWAKGQVDSKTFPLVAPAVVFGRVVVPKAVDADPKGKPIKPRAAKP